MTTTATVGVVLIDSTGRAYLRALCRLHNLHYRTEHRHLHKSSHGHGNHTTGLWTPNWAGTLHVPIASRSTATRARPLCGRTTFSTAVAPLRPAGCPAAAAVHTRPSSPLVSANPLEDISVQQSAQAPRLSRSHHLSTKAKHTSRAVTPSTYLTARAEIPILGNCPEQ